MKERMHNKKKLEPFRKRLRGNLTSAESFLWVQLQQRKLEGRKFRRQHSIRKYIVDFYCPEENIIIELDGQGHFNPEGLEKDIKRDEILTHLGFKVIRFENRLVFENLDYVLSEIKRNFR